MRVQSNGDISEARPFVLMCSLQTVETNTLNTSTSAAASAAGGGDAGRDDVAYHVTESEFISCRLDTSLVNSTVSAGTAYDRLQSASNYFIGDAPLSGRLARYFSHPCIITCIISCTRVHARLLDNYCVNVYKINK